jgi:hypothetical protein
VAAAVLVVALGGLRGAPAWHLESLAPGYDPRADPYSLYSLTVETGRDLGHRVRAQLGKYSKRAESRQESPIRRCDICPGSGRSPLLRRPGGR